MKISIFFILFICGVQNSFSGTEFSVKVEGLGAKKTISSQKIWIEKDRICLNLYSEGNKEALFIYRKDKDAIYMVDIAGKSYTEMTRADLKKMGERLQEAKAQMQAAMKNVPPEQRAMIEKMMGGQMANPEVKTPAKTEFKKSGNSKVGPYAVTEYEVFDGGVKTALAYVTDYSSIQLSREDFSVLKDLSNFYQEFAQSLSFGALSKFRDMEKFQGIDAFPGFPVRMITLDSTGKEGMRVELADIKKTTIPASQFDVPAGFEKKNMDFGGLSGDRKAKAKK